MCACASSSCTMLIAVPNAFRLGASCAARKYAGALISSVSAETVRMRLMPSRYVGDMCSRPSISLPLLMRWRVVASGFICTAMWVSSFWEMGFRSWDLGRARARKWRKLLVWELGVGSWDLGRERARKWRKLLHWELGFGI